MEVWILANTRAGKHKARQEGESVRRVFALGGARVRMAYTGSLEEAEGFLQRAAAQKPDLLVCCGGDGTLSHAVGFLGELGAPMPLGFVPMGPTNDFANSLGMPKEPARAAEQILHGESHRLDLGSFEGRRFLYVASFGAFTQSSYKAPPQVKATLGHLAYVLESARELPFLQAIPLEAEVDGDLVQGEFLFGAVSNATSLGGVMKLSPEQVQLDDGFFELTLIRKPQTPVELGQIVQLLHHGRQDGSLVIRRPVTRCVFRGQEGFDWSLDGECVPGGAQVGVEVLPQALELVY